MSKPSSTSTMVPTDQEASRRMHEYLLAQQRRKEEYWLRKYGKVLVPRVTPQQPERERRVPPLDTGAPPPTTLPPIRQAKRTGQAPMFSAKEPISTFPMKGAPLHTNRRPVNIKANNLPTTLPPIKRAGEAEQDRRQEFDGGVPSPIRPSPKGGRPLDLKLQSPKPGAAAEADEPPQQSPAGGKFTLPPMDLPSVEGHAWYQGPGTQASAELPRASLPARGNGVTTVRDLQMEVAVLKAIKAREDTLDRLKVACGKLDTGFGGGAPVVLSPVDPLVRLFYRLVGTLRMRTLDAVEAVAAWQRKSGSRDPFIYYGADYLASIGADLKFLDDLSFMSSRRSSRAAAEDPFLMDVTADGVPLEEATTCDLRRGATRFSSEALRIRMARKVLAACSSAHRANLGSPTNLSIQDSEEFAAVLAQERKADPLAFLPAVHQYSSARARTPDTTYAQPSQAARLQERQASLRTVLEPIQRDLGGARPEAQAQAQAAGEQAGAGEVQVQEPGPAGGLSGDGEEQKRCESPAAATGSWDREEDEAAAARGVDMPGEDSGVLIGGVSEMEASGMEQEQEQPGMGGEPLGSGNPGPWVEEEAAGTVQEEEKQREEEAAALQGDDPVAAKGSCGADETLEAESSGRAVPEEPAAGPAVWPEALEGLEAEDADEVLLQSVLTEAEEVLDLDDGHFIDDMVDALVASLEEPYGSCIEDGGFTVAGWEIDRELDLMILGIAEDEGLEHGLRGLISDLEVDVSAAPGGSSPGGHAGHTRDAGGAATWGGSELHGFAAGDGDSRQWMPAAAVAQAQQGNLYEEQVAATA